MGDAILVTRPEPGASRTAAYLTALGLEPIVAPVLRIVPMAASLPAAERIAAVLATSGNAVDVLPPAYHALPLLTVGDATASRARTAGFRAVASADGDAAALAALARATLVPTAGALVLASGERQGGTLADALRQHGFIVHRRVVYRSAAVTRLSEPATVALRAGTVRAALFFSAETAEQFVRLARRAGLTEAVRASEAVAIGQAASMALTALPWRRIRVAAKPTQDAMLALLR